MKKPAFIAGFLGAALVVMLAAQHTVLAMELSSFNLGDIAIANQYQEQEMAQAEDTGEVLSASTNESSEVESEPAAEEQAVEPAMVTVAKGDTLSKIAKAHGTTYKRLFDANESIADPNVINPGDQIRIPSEDEVLPERALPAPKVVEAPKPAQKSTAPRPITKSTAPAVASGSVWDQLAQCESGGNWQINTGNGYYGGLQFTASTWRAVGGTGLPHQHSREEQILRAEILLARSGWGQWPACTAKLGLR